VRRTRAMCLAAQAGSVLLVLLPRSAPALEQQVSSPPVVAGINVELLNMDFHKRFSSLYQSSVVLGVCHTPAT